jgi:protein-S-isoprenylcysteine O-methyltransferase Ste14
VTPADSPPRSASSLAISAVGCLGLVAGVILLRTVPLPADLRPIIAVAATAAPMLLWAVFVERAHRDPAAGLDWDRPRPLRAALATTAVKLVGLWATWAVIAGLYALARPLHGAIAYGAEVAAHALPILLPVSAVYVFVVDRVMVEPRDELWQAGALILRRPGADPRQLPPYARAWAVKGFFLGFMFSILPGGTAALAGQPLAPLLDDPVRLAGFAIAAVFTFDLVFGTVGYLCALRAAGTYIRSANPYLSGWVAALICYPPFVLMGPGSILSYTPGTRAWSDWLAGQPGLILAYGGLLAVLAGVYAWSTVIFGLRFSNLTHRGIITNGPYRWARHPAYLSKNTFWWFAHLPFLVTTGPAEAVRNCVLLLLVNAVYWWRAKTEEKHLRADPVYLAYADWTERRLPLPRLRQALSRRFGSAAYPARP